MNREVIKTRALDIIPVKVKELARKVKDKIKRGE